MSRRLTQDELDAIGARVDGFIAAVEAIRSLPFENSSAVADAIEYSGELPYAFEVAGWLVNDDELLAGTIREWLLSHRAGFPYDFSVMWSSEVVAYARYAIREFDVDA